MISVKEARLRYNISKEIRAKEAFEYIEQDYEMKKLFDWFQLNLIREIEHCKTTFSFTEQELSEKFLVTRNNEKWKQLLCDLGYTLNLNYKNQFESGAVWCYELTFDI